MNIGFAGCASRTVNSVPYGARLHLSPQHPLASERHLIASHQNAPAIMEALMINILRLLDVRIKRTQTCQLCWSRADRAASVRCRPTT